MKLLKKDIVETVLQKTKKGGINDLKICSLSNLCRCLGREEIEFIKKFLSLDPREYGFKGEFLGINGIPNGLISIKNQEYELRKRTCVISEQFLTPPVFSAYVGMNSVLREETGRRLLIASGYRSPAHQIVVFFRQLKANNFDFQKTASTVAFPGYSEHGDAKRLAVDFMTANGVGSPQRSHGFEATREYKWMEENAGAFGFSLSYPKNNRHGIIFEPWHWRFVR